MGKHKKDKKSKKSKKRSRSSSSSSSDNEKKKRKRSKKDKKGLKSIDELIKERLKNKPQESEKVQNFGEEEKKSVASQHKPMTKEEYDKKQSVVKRVFDEDTGRMRLVKGDGEIIEEIVSASRQKEINKMATHSDGQSFQASLNSKLK